jgi:hypothetical protein
LSSKPRISLIGQISLQNQEPKIMTACFDGAGPSEEKFVARIQLVTMAINNRVGMKPLVASNSRQAASSTGALVVRRKDLPLARYSCDAHRHLP